MSNINPIPLEPRAEASSLDLNWDYAPEIIKLLNLAVIHIKESMHVGDDSVDALTDSFTHMARNIKSIQQSLEELPDSVSSELNQDIAGKCESLNEQVHNAIIAFQFYDRLIQKLTHVNDSMDNMSNLIIDQSRLVNPVEWTELQNNIRANYTMESERMMFDALMRGASVKEAMEQAEQEDGVNGQTGDIELF